jgi:membrane-associated phospholipid phosphatase
LSGLVAGLFAQILKKVVGRSRPELWLGPFEFTRDAASAFPSGHTVGAFALAAAIAFTVQSRITGAFALLLAAGVGLSRILAFRHWPSDVLASALIGVGTAWVFAAGVTRLTKPDESRP